MNLGRMVCDIRRRGNYVKDDPVRYAELTAMGFRWSASQERSWIRNDDPRGYVQRWEGVRDALRTYKEVHGDLVVERPFVVPAQAPWPEEAWGMKLGRQVGAIRNSGRHVHAVPERRAELDALGFVWDEYERRWEEARAALLAYKEVRGDLVVQKQFVVPSQPPWPEDTWGVRIGRRIDGIRRGEHVEGHPERRAELDALGFVWDAHERQWEEVRVALQAYNEVHGNLEVPRRFAVPSEAPWPEEAWGMKLGSRANAIRNREHHVKDHPERRAELDALGFRW